MLCAGGRSGIIRIWWSSILFYKKCQKSIVMIAEESCRLWGSRAREVTFSHGSFSLNFWPVVLGAPVNHQERNVCLAIPLKYEDIFFSSCWTLVRIYNPQSTHCSPLCYFLLIFYVKASFVNGCWYQTNLDSTWEAHLALLAGRPVAVIPFWLLIPGLIQLLAGLTF